MHKLQLSVSVCVPSVCRTSHLDGQHLSTDNQQIEDEPHRAIDSNKSSKIIQDHPRLDIYIYIYYVKLSINISHSLTINH